MKLVTYHYRDHVHLGGIHENHEHLVVDLSTIAPNMLALIAMGETGLRQAREAVATAKTAVPLPAVRLLAPLQPPRNPMCLGLNYAEHARESYGAAGKETKLPQAPIVFTKATTAVAGPYDDIPYDPDVSTEIDWEVELGVIIGRGDKNVSADAALDHVFGYTVVNDVSARDLQRQGKQYFKGKSLDGHFPTGPWIVTKDELPNPGNLRLTSRVNGETKQVGNTNQMIFNVAQIIAYLSRGMTLLPGDIIATGTPAGVGFARTPPQFLTPGDVVESEIEGVGALSNAVRMMV